eukprot:361463-Chlamydomonas_euryale.AAC.4
MKCRDPTCWVNDWECGVRTPQIGCRGRWERGGSLGQGGGRGARGTPVCGSLQLGAGDDGGIGYAVRGARKGDSCGTFLEVVREMGGRSWHTQSRVEKNDVWRHVLRSSFGAHIHASIHPASYELLTDLHKMDGAHTHTHMCVHAGGRADPGRKSGRTPVAGPTRRRRPRQPAGVPFTAHAAAQHPQRPLEVRCAQQTLR